MILLVYNSFIFHSIYYNMHIVPYFALKNPTLFFFFLFPCICLFPNRMSNSCYTWSGVCVCVQNTFRINGETHSLYTVMFYRMTRSFKNIKHRRNSLFTKKKNILTHEGV